MKRHIFKNKGFTLVECIVAIAAFAVITSMVMMILAGTATTQQKSMKAEADLNQLVENVVRDDSAQKFDTDTSKTLLMSVGGSTINFSMTYNSISGYKNFVVCPGCNKTLNNIDFMTCVYDPASTANARYVTDIALNPSHQSYKACFWFDPKTDDYVCPDCGKTFKAYSTSGDSTELWCEDCQSLLGASDFTFDHYNGGFSCNKCGSSRVSDKKVKTENSTDSPFSVGNMQANAIRFGKLKENKPEADEIKTFMVMSDSENKNFHASLSYNPNTKVTLPGTYKLQIDSYNIGDATATIKIEMPPCYICDVVRTSQSCDGAVVTEGRRHADISVMPPDKYDDYTDHTVITISNITTKDTGTSFWFEFKLTNYENNNSFEEDYKSDGGLSKFWFGWSTSNCSYPIA